MEPLTIGIVALVALVVLVAIEVPIGAAIGLVALVSYTALANLSQALYIFSSVTSEVLANREMATIPLFLLMGGFATAGGLSEDIYRLAYAMVGRFRGGLAVSTVFGCAGFGAICGSSAATAATMTQVALPEMLKRSYAPSLASGSLAAGGSLGMLVPPSIIMVMYAYLTEQFVLDLFLAAIIPAALAVLGYWLAIVVVVRLNPAMGPPGQRMTGLERWKAVKGAWGAILLGGIVAGGIYSGILTVLEGAAVGAILSVVLALLRRRLTWSGFFSVLLESAANTGMLYVIIIGASIFSFSIAVSTLPEVLVEEIKSANLAPIVVIFLLLLIYLVAGSIFETISSIVITLPFVFPLVLELGYDPVWWGVTMIVMIEIGLITPPVGMNVFIVHGLARDVPMRGIFAGIVPFLLADLIRLAILVFFPVLSLWLPQVL